MEVIKHGNTYNEVVCVKCCALLSYCKIDMASRYDLDTHNFTKEKYIKCPECGNYIMVSRGGI